MKIFDLFDKHDYKINDLQNNLIKFENKYGNNFNVKYNDIIINVKLSKMKTYDDVEFYNMTYDIEKRTTHLKPFSIDFFDIMTGKLNNNSYINNINKTNDINGTNLVKICLKINEILGVKITFLGDGTKVICDKNNEEMDLSFIKLIEKNKTFYMNFGFKFDTSYFSMYNISNKDKIQDKVDTLINNIRNIKINTLIKKYKKTLSLIILAIKDNYKNEFNIKYHDNTEITDNYYYSDKPITKINDLFIECREVLEILYKYQDKKYLYKILVDTFKNDCSIYTKLNKYIIDNYIVEISYGNISIKRNYIINVNLLYRYRYSYFYSYTFY